MHVKKPTFCHPPATTWPCNPLIWMELPVCGIFGMHLA